VGNFDAKPMRLVSGITGAAPLFRDIMLALNASATDVLPFSKPEGIVTVGICPHSGMLVKLTARERFPSSSYKAPSQKNHATCTRC